MMKSFLAYGTTIAVTIATFTVLANSSGNDDNYAKETNDYHETQITKKNKTVLSLQQAIDIVLTQRGGQVMEAERKRKGGKTLYEIKGFDTHGKRYRVYLNAENGQTLKHDGND